MASFLAALLSAVGLGKAPTEGQWTVATGEVDGRPLILRLRSSAPANSTSYPELVVVRWSYEIDSSGLPSTTVRERMERLEDLLTNGLERSGVALHVATETSNGVREWRWYARSSESMMQAVNGALSSEPAFPIEFFTFQDPDWDAYNALAAQAE